MDVDSQPRFVVSHEEVLEIFCCDSVGPQVSRQLQVMDVNVVKLVPELAFESQLFRNVFIYDLLVFISSGINCI